MNTYKMIEVECMLDKQDMIDLIEVYEAAEYITKQISNITGNTNPFGSERSKDNYKTFDIILRNSKFSDSDSDIEQLIIILYSNLRPEDKYRLITSKE